VSVSFEGSGEADEDGVDIDHVEFFKVVFEFVDALIENAFMEYVILG
jgi:hypothetical protein